MTRLSRRSTRRSRTALRKLRPLAGDAGACSQMPTGRASPCEILPGCSTIRNGWRCAHCRHARGPNLSGKTQERMAARAAGTVPASLRLTARSTAVPGILATRSSLKAPLLKSSYTSSTSLRVFPSEAFRVPHMWCRRENYSGTRMPPEDAAKRFSGWPARSVRIAKRPPARGSCGLLSERAVVT